MKECCSNCKHCMTLEKWDYSKVEQGEWKEYMDGFVCNAFSGEGDAIWMAGLDPEKDQCEMWTKKREETC